MKYKYSKAKPIKKNKHKINNAIQANEVLLVTDKGLKQMTKIQALDLAKNAGVDLLEVNGKKTPPICKLIDYGKFLYDQKKKEKFTKKNELKSIRISFNISDHDLETKENKVKKFLNDGNKVKVFMMLRGREMNMKDIAKEKVLQFAQNFEEISQMDELKIQGKNIFLFLNPNHTKKK